MPMSEYVHKTDETPGIPPDGPAVVATDATRCPKRERADMAMEIDSRVERKLIHLSEDKKKYVSAFCDGFIAAFVVIMLVQTIMGWSSRGE
jgi:hypothetical protein